MNGAQRAHALRPRLELAKKLTQAIKQEAWPDALAIAMGIAMGIALERRLSLAQFHQLTDQMWQSVQRTAGEG